MIKFKRSMTVRNFTTFFSILVFLGGCTKPSAQKIAPVEKVSENAVRVNDDSSLKIESASAKPFPVSIELSGKIAVPDKDIVTLSARVSGRLESLLVSLGDRVSAGMTVGTVWSSDLATAAEEYALALKEGGEILRLTKSKLNALGVSPGELAPGKTTFSLRSPMNGVVLEKKLNSGAAVNPGDPILTIGKLDSAQFVGDLTPDLAVQVKEGMEVRFDEVQSLTGNVSSVSPISDPSTRLVRVKVRFTSKLPKELPQESFLRARIILKEIPSLVLPLKALFLVGETEYVFVQSEKDPKVFERQAVKVANRTATEFAVSAESFKKTDVKVISGGALLVNDALDDGADK